MNQATSGNNYPLRRIVAGATIVAAGGLSTAACSPSNSGSASAENRNNFCTVQLGGKFDSRDQVDNTLHNYDHNYNGQGTLHDGTTWKIKEIDTENQTTVQQSGDYIVAKGVDPAACNKVNGQYSFNVAPTTTPIPLQPTPTQSFGQE